MTVAIALPTTSGAVTHPDGNEIDEVTGLTVASGTVVLRNGNATGPVLLALTGPGTVNVPESIHCEGLWAICTSGPVASVLV